MKTNSLPINSQKKVEKVPKMCLGGISIGGKESNFELKMPSRRSGKYLTTNGFRQSSK